VHGKFLPKNHFHHTPIDVVQVLKFSFPSPRERKFQERAQRSHSFSMSKYTRPIPGPDRPTVVGIAFLRETSPFYVYSNPITPGEAAAASRSIEILDSDEGRERITHLHAMTTRFREGLERLGHETLHGPHPVVPLMVRDPARTRTLVRHLRSAGVLATGLHFPVVPQGEDEIRFQISSDHSPHDIDDALTALSSFPAPG
jgi:hypothetical protein